MDDGVPTIQARFDDLLSGAERSFRLVGPVGVTEARRPEEVAPALGALEATAAEGLWAAGFVAYEAAPGLDPDLEVRSRPADDPFADLPLPWFAMFEACQDDPLDEDAGPTASTGPWTPSVDRAAYDAAIERIHAHIAAGDTYQVNHTLPTRSRFDGDERDLYGDLCLAQRGGCAAYLNAGRYRRALGLAGAVLPDRRRPHHHATDEGHRAARPLDGRGRRGRRPPGRLGEGARRERDDR